MQREGCQNGSLSYNSGMARPIVAKFGGQLETKVMQTAQIMGREHLLERTCTFTPVLVSREQLDRLQSITLAIMLLSLHRLDLILTRGGPSLSLSCSG